MDYTKFAEKIGVSFNSLKVYLKERYGINIYADTSFGSSSEKIQIIDKLLAGKFVSNPVILKNLKRELRKKIK
ncbi:MAG TPA: hypothetical protein PLA68_14870 [Panacibacter sp.]|nr:hypothetical protein [Panacibacter sp.]